MTDAAEPETEVVSVPSVAAALPVAVCLIAADDTVLAWNARMAQLFGLGGRDALGRRFRDLEISFRVPGLRAAVEHVKAGRGAERLIDIAAPGPVAGTVVTVSVSPVGDEAQPPAVLVCAEDRSEVATLTAQARILDEELQTSTERMRETSEAMSTANEELRNPMAPIVSAVRVLRLHPSEFWLVQHAREVVERQVLHQARLLDDLLDDLLTRLLAEEFRPLR